MMVGPSGSGKTSAWRCLLSALEALDNVKGEAHVIDPKAIGVYAIPIIPRNYLIPTWKIFVFFHTLVHVT